MNVHSYLCLSSFVRLIKGRPKFMGETSARFATIHLQQQLTDDKLRSYNDK